MCIRDSPKPSPAGEALVGSIACRRVDHNDGLSHQSAWLPQSGTWTPRGLPSPGFQPSRWGKAADNYRDFSGRHLFAPSLHMELPGFHLAGINALQDGDGHSVGFFGGYGDRLAAPEGVWLLSLDKSQPCSFTSTDKRIVLLNKVNYNFSTQRWVIIIIIFYGTKLIQLLPLPLTEHHSQNRLTGYLTCL